VCFLRFLCAASRVVAIAMLRYSVTFNKRRPNLIKKMTRRRLDGLSVKVTYDELARSFSHSFVVSDSLFALMVVIILMKSANTGACWNSIAL